MVGSGARMGNNTKKLRSCMFGHKRIPSREGGIEVVVEELSTRMVKLGHQVTCYNRGGHHVSGKEFDGERLHEYKGVKLKTVPTINRKGLTAVSSSFFAALAAAFGRYDVVHIHAEGPAAMCWIPKLFGKRVVVTIHGYVGLSISVLLAQHEKVFAVDIVPSKVEMVNQRKSPIQDEYIDKYLAEQHLDLTATLDAKMAYSAADFVVIAAPTNYDSSTQHFDTSAVENVIDLVMKYNPNAIMVIKSTIPVGYTKSIREKMGSKNILFSPEFLRESKALYDNVYPKFFS